MREIKYYLNKYKYKYILILLGLIIIILGYYLISKPKSEEKVITSTIKESAEILEKEENIEENKVLTTIKVDIKGEVKKPGVYELTEGDRVIDIIDKAQGLTKNANTEYLNLSKKLVDEMVIIIYSKDEIKKFKETKEEIVYIEYECECPDNLNDACIEDKNEEKESEDTLISINTATKEQLMKLPGIGESKALKIIEFREENGNFKEIEELKNVSGIGESIYTKIKDYIKV